MKRIKRIFKEDKDTFLKEISNLRTKETGLSKGILSISTKEGNQNPRVKLYRGRPGEDKPFASITINENPKVVEDSIGITSKEIKEVTRFILQNIRILLKIWDEGAFSILKNSK